MKKSTAIILVSALCAASIGVGAIASEVIRDIRAEIRPDFTIEIDGEIKQFKNADGDVVYPILYDGTTYLPVRAIGELMGKTVYWFEDDKRIELREKTSTVTDADVIVTGTSEKENKNVTEHSAQSAKTADNAKKPNDVKTDGGIKKDIPDTSEFIGAEKAKEIALEKAGLASSDVVFARVELDKEGFVYVYEVDFRSGRTEYEADISATDGKIVKWDVDYDD